MKVVSQEALCDVIVHRLKQAVAMPPRMPSTVGVSQMVS